MFEIGQKVRRTTDIFAGARYYYQKKGYEFRIVDIKRGYFNTEYIYKCRKNTWHSERFLELIEDPKIEWE
jgi:hypothetical protein